MDGGARVAEVLKRHGVPYLFTLVGGHISPILVGAEARGIRVIDVRHEVNAVFAADAVGRLTGIPGVAAVTAGPGVSNAITAIKNAQLAQSPLVLIGGATATILRGRGSLQDIDQTALMKPHVKWMARPTRLRDVIPVMERAMHEAASGVPGPVFVELAVNLLYGEDMVREEMQSRFEKPDPSLAEQAINVYLKGHLRWTYQRSGDPRFHDPKPPEIPTPGRGEVRKAADLLATAQRPLMVLGSQVMLDPKRIDALVRTIEHIGAPVYLSGMARGLLGQGHPLQMRHKRRAALKAADVVVLAGVPNDFRMDYGGHVSRAQVIGLSRSTRDLNLNRRPQIGIEADPQRSLEAIAALMPTAPDRSVWMGELQERDAARNAEIDTMAEQDGELLNPLAFCKRLDTKLDDDSVLVGDGGDFVATVSYTVSPRGPLSWLDPGVFGTLGVGAGFAMGAKLVRPDADVWLLWGDGAAGFSIMELDTFARHGLPVISVVGNDAGWTQILRDQEPVLGSAVACQLTHMDYHTVADGCGGKGFVVSEANKVDGVLDEAITTSRSGTPVLVNALLGRSDFRKGSLSM
ncbi:MAG: thiamine pyrophosphate-binding protein [Myxococcales bacterium]|nr:thiamine pyrophosphate-binding protein [Myxococcales bacterium]